MASTSGTKGPFETDWQPTKRFVRAHTINVDDFRDEEGVVDTETVPSSLSVLVPVLRAALAIEKENPRVSYLSINALCRVDNLPIPVTRARRDVFIDDSTMPMERLKKVNDILDWIASVFGFQRSSKLTSPECLEVADRPFRREPPPDRCLTRSHARFLSEKLTGAWVSRAALQASVCDAICFVGLAGPPASCFDPFQVVGHTLGGRLVVAWNFVVVWLLPWNFKTVWLLS
uniref:Callose synthase 6 n=1 Tax=Cajanus cajan TaxID=3821 RepID=A0A151SBR7_CAJCA|nr:Putative callose synthase 6 [Cajanus cajan]